MAVADDHRPLDGVGAAEPAAMAATSPAASSAWIRVEDTIWSPWACRGMAIDPIPESAELGQQGRPAAAL